MNKELENPLLEDHKLKNMDDVNKRQGFFSLKFFFFYFISFGNFQLNKKIQS